jgi:hypothetical protein
MSITHDNICTTEDIFEPNLRSLKGKTVSCPSMPVMGQIDGVLMPIKEKYQFVMLVMDIMFVNKIPFLLTISCGLHFGTAKNLSNQQVMTNCCFQMSYCSLCLPWVQD